ncbi:MAG: FHA domain-containing protein [Planctomycetaceae bacterium]
MKVVLELQDQPSNIRRVTVRHDIVIGRGADCNLRLSAPQVSRRHCFLRISKDGVSVTDLDSSNGTWLNGQKLSSGKRFTLSDGAVLAVGPIRFVARVESESPAAGLMEINVADQSLEADVEALSDDLLPTLPQDEFEGTLAVSPGASGPSDAMKFSLEHAGPSAEDDEATADYVSDEVLENSRFADSPVEADDESLLEDLPLFADDDAEPTAVVSEADLVTSEADFEDGFLDADLIEVIDEDVVEVVEDDIGEIIELDDDALEFVDEHEVLLVDDDDLIEVIDDGEEPEVVEEPAARRVKPVGNGAEELEADLKNFLKGLE